METAVQTPTKSKSVDKPVSFDFAIDFDRMKTIFYPMMTERFGNDVEIKSIDVDVLRSRAKRCVLLYKINAISPTQSKEVQWRVIGKAYRAESGQKGFDNMMQLWKNGFSRDVKDGLGMPEPLVFIPKIQMLFQEEVPGEALRVLVKTTPKKEYFAQLARSLVKLHTCNIKPKRTFTVRNHLLRCHPKYPFLSMACPELESKIDYIVNRAFEIEKSFNGIQLTPFHGDFHLGQAHVLNDDIWLIDFDTLSYGDPAADVGNILVFFKGKLRRHPEYQGYIDTFLDTYFSAMDPKIAERVPLYEALTHLRRSCKRLRSQDNNWRQVATEMIEKSVEAINSIKFN